jgi:tRNA (guanine37-N1)-methyltransferase
MNITVVTLFPELFPGPLNISITKRALDQKVMTIQTVNIRDFAKDRHKSVDDTPYGGGVGMILKPDVVYDAMEYAKTLHLNNPTLIFLSPRGEILKQFHFQNLSMRQDLIILCGRYEGIDQRVIDYYVHHHAMIEMSMGDYIMTGGELGAYIIIDGCARLLPGVLEKTEATSIESFSNSLLEFSHYTKPSIWMNQSVPEVLLSGHHQKIEAWRKHNAHEVTKKRRPDLLKKL